MALYGCTLLQVCECISLVSSHSKPVLKVNCILFPSSLYHVLYKMIKEFSPSAGFYEFSFVGCGPVMNSVFCLIHVLPMIYSSHTESLVVDPWMIFNCVLFKGSAG